MLLSHLEPKAIWGYFEEICAIPRLSKNEEEIRQYLIEFASKNSLEVKQDRIGNLLIIKEADPGYQNIKPVLLQSHMDMVGEKDADTEHNWLKDPIIPIIKDGWVTAEVTTLGADDGIGIAAQMAVLTDPDIKSGKIECLFTVDEETGMTGAINLEPGFFESRTLLNLDSEDEGELFIGCAGGVDTIATFSLRRDKYDNSGTPVSISVTGLHGGHSGDEIHGGYANSVKVIARLLTDLDKSCGLRIANLDAGNLRNAIPREAFAEAIIVDGTFEDSKTRVDKLLKQLRSEFKDTEPKLSITISESVKPETVLDKSIQDNLLLALMECPHGVIAWSSTIDNLVETSTNLASVKFGKENIRVVTSQRSSVTTSKFELSDRIRSVFVKSGAEVLQSDGYPGWEPDTNSEILKITVDAYLKIFGTKPVVRAIHAGLECGLILEKYTGLDMISFGPTIKGAHTPEEKLNIATTQKFWDLLVEVIARIPEKKG